jgi:UDP-N-acetylmuramate--alanine ligase
MPEVYDTAMGRARNIHFVGIGGAGMCGIAEILHNLGYSISGSDLKPTNVTLHLEGLGIPVHFGHGPENISGADVVVVSSAVSIDNPEVQSAKLKRIPVIPRAEMLAEIMRFRHGIAVAGTHGKTTTTSLIASILADAELDPTYVIGGLLNSINTNAKLGSGKYLVAEADESDASFMHLQPVFAVLTNIDADHLGTYEGDFDRLSNTFVEFLQRLPFYGFAVLCLEDDATRKVIPLLSKPYITYGFGDESDYIAKDISIDHQRSYFSVHRPGRKPELKIELNMPGRHNVLNALAAIALGTELEVPDHSILNALKNFQGIARRCNLLGSIEYNDKKMSVIDDYAHHPNELKATLNAIRDGWLDQELLVIFQPHRYTRTRALFNEFCDLLSREKNLILLDVYPAGEEPIQGADTVSLYNCLSVGDDKNFLHIKNVNEVYAVIPEMMFDNGIILIMGAGDIATLGPGLINNFGKTIH